MPDCTKPCKTKEDSQNDATKPLGCQTLQNDRGLTKLPMIIGARDKNFDDTYPALIYIMQQINAIGHWYCYSNTWQDIPCECVSVGWVTNYSQIQAQTQLHQLT